MRTIPPTFKIFKGFLFLLALLAATPAAWAQTSIPNTTAVTQNFDGMGTSTTAALPANWRFGTEGNANPAWAAGLTNAQQGASTGTPNAGGRYNWGNGSTTSDRSPGFITSGGYNTPNSIMGYYRNNTGSIIGSLAVSYNGERYRINSTAASIQFFYSTDGTNWTAVTAGDIAATSFPTGSNSYSFSPPLSVPASCTITGLSIANGTDFYLRWSIITGASNSQGIGIDDVSVTATLATACSTPTTQASAAASASATTTGATISWANGAATAGSLVVIRPSASANVAPTSGTAYTANANYPAGGLVGAVGSNNRVVYQGAGTSVAVTGLTAGTQYTATIYAYNSPGNCYNTTAPTTVDFYTLANEPTAHPATFTCTTVSTSQINLSFSPASSITNASGYIILRRLGGTPTGLPTDGIFYNVDDIIGNATVIGYVGSGTTTFAATGLNAGNAYGFSIIPYGSFLSVPETLNYKTDATIRTTACITVTAPEINIRGAGQTINPGNTPIGVDNTLFATQSIMTTSAPKTFEIQNLGNANLVLTGASPYVFLGGANPGDFAISSAPATPVTPSTSSNFNITFTPTAAGIRTATVTVYSNDADEATYTFNIQGNGDGNEIDVFGNGVSIPSGSATASTTNHTQFGNVNVTTGSATQTFAVFNTGGLSLTVSSVTITGPDAAHFTVTTSPVGTLPGGTSNNLVIVFDPSSAGVKNATVTINNNDLDESVYTFAIQGTGVNFITCGLGAYQTIAQQDFEAAPAAPVMTYVVTQEAGAGAYTVAGGTNYGANHVTKTNMFAGARSFQVAGPLPNSGTERWVQVEFATVNAAAYQDVLLTFSLGAYTSYNGNNPPPQGLDSGDEHVYVYVSTNGGTTWSHEMSLFGNNNSIWDINTSTGSATGTFDGNNIPLNYNTTSGGKNVGPRTVTLDGLPSSSQIKVRILMSVDRQDEFWVIDNVQIRGKGPAETIWNGTSWSNGVPTPSVKAIIDGPYTSNATYGSIETCQCEVRSGRTLNITSPYYLEIQDNLLNSGTVNLGSGSSLVQINPTAANTGTISMARTVSMKKYDYVYWSAPVGTPPTGTFPVGSISPGTASNFIYKWIPTVGGEFGIWQGTAENMIPGKGYIVRGAASHPTTLAPFTATFTGQPNNGNIPATIERGSRQNNYVNGNGITVTNKDDNWNLVGNPYPSAIWARRFLQDNTNIEGAVRLWTHGALPSAAQPDPFYNNFLYNYDSNDYIVYNGTGVTSGPGTFNGYIASGQAFFIQMNDGPAATQTVNFTNDMRSKSYGNTEFFRPRATSLDAVRETGDEEGRLWLDIIGPDQKVSRTLLGYVADATLDKDRMFDAHARIDGSLGVFTMIADEPMNIQGRPIPFQTDDVVPVAFNATANGNQKIAINNTDGFFTGAMTSIYLEDKQLGLTHDLRQAPYEFSANTGLNTSRFILRFENAALGNTGFDAALGHVSVWTKDHAIHMESRGANLKSVAVFDLTGRQIYAQDKLETLQFTTAEMSARNQVLILSVTLSDGSKSSRKIVIE